MSDSISTARAEDISAQLSALSRPMASYPRAPDRGEAMTREEFLLLIRWGVTGGDELTAARLAALGDHDAAQRARIAELEAEVERLRSGEPTAKLICPICGGVGTNHNGPHP